MEYTQSLLIDPDGTTVWTGPHHRRAECLTVLRLDRPDGGDALAALCGAAFRPDGSPWVSHSEVFHQAQALGLLSTQGTARGFVFLPPPGVVLERSVAAFNAAHLRNLEAVEIDFPVAFDHARPDIVELTRGYADGGRLFKLADTKLDTRLAYAADPHLFNWLRGRRLRQAALPYTIVSEVEVLRRFRDGELGRTNRVHQYRLPDVHTFVSAADAEGACLRAVELAADAVSFWCSDAWVQFVDLTDGFLRAHPDLLQRMARTARKATLVNVLRDRPRYYAMRSGIMPDAGTGALMLYNLQWDEENPLRFDIGIDDGSELVVLHMNAAAGSGVLCVVLGRALAGHTERLLPPELASHQVVLQPIADRFAPLARDLAHRLQQRGLRAAVSSRQGPLGKVLRRHAEAWQPLVAIVGEQESTRPLVFQPPGGDRRMEEDAFFAAYGSRLSRCRWDNGTTVRPLPIADS